MAAARPALLCRRTQLALLATCNFPNWLLALKPLEPRKNALMLASDLAQSCAESETESALCAYSQLCDDKLGESSACADHIHMLGLRLG
ncbi:hypothetical protein ACLKA6_007795 [Drosophila palustris]